MRKSTLPLLGLVQARTQNNSDIVCLGGTVRRESGLSCSQQHVGRPYALLCASTYLNDQDVAHELMEQAVQKAGDYLSRHPDISVFKLAGQIRNGIRRRAGQIARKKGREISLGSLSDLQHLCAEASEVEQRAIAKELFSRLSPFAQSVLNRRWMGYRWREIATDLEIDHTVVRRAYFRELKSLLRSLSPSGESPQ